MLLAELEARQFPLVQSCVFPRLVSTLEDVRKVSAEAEQKLNAHIGSCRFCSLFLSHLFTLNLPLLLEMSKRTQWGKENFIWWARLYFFFPLVLQFYIGKWIWNIYVFILEYSERNLSNCLDYQPIEVKSADLSKPWFRLPAGLILVCCCTDYYYAPLCVCWLYKLMYNGDRISVFLCFKASLTISLLAGCCWIWVSYSLGPPGGIFDIETKWQKIYLS